MRNIKLTFLALIVFSTCNHKIIMAQVGHNDEKFNRFKSNYLEDLWYHNPEWATSVGYHKYDSVLSVNDKVSRNATLNFYSNYLDSLKKFDLKTLSENNKTDYELIKNSLEGSIWYINEFKSYTWNPAEYNIGGTFSEILYSGQYPEEERLRNISLKLKMVKQYYKAAKENLNNPVKDHTLLAISQVEGSKSVFNEEIPSVVQKSKLSESEKKQLNERCKEALLEIDSYIAYLKSLKFDNARSFRIGKELFEKKFKYDIQSKYSAKEIYDIALKRKQYLHEKMYDLANKLWSKYLGNEDKPKDSLLVIRKVIDKLSLQHANVDSFQIAIDQQIPALVEFIKQKNLIYIDPSKPLVVRKEPAYMQGVAGASISSPGPYDKNGNTYYNVGSLAGYSKEDAESFLREYNNYTLQILNIHEAIPGHYTQLVYSNNSPSLIKSILGNGAMIEGWAVYGELMMLENGYGNNSPEMWLMYYKWHLRTVCNTILDYSLHVNNMSENEAMNLLIKEAFQQDAEAKGKFKRASLTQVQLCSYFTGFSEIYELREKLKQKQGKEFNLKNFHEKFLSFGSAPVKNISELMLNELK